MKNTLKYAALAAAVITAAGSAQASYVTGDLLIGFTTGSGKDLVYDLGAFSTLGTTKSWDLSSLLTSSVLANSNLKWGVIGNGIVNSTKTAWSTAASTAPSTISSSTYTAIGNLDNAIFGTSRTGGEGKYNNVTLASTANSWYSQTVNPSLTTQYKNVNGYVDLSGTGSISFYQQTANAVSDIGSFSLSDKGIVTFTEAATPVPEPSTVFAGLGLLALTVRSMVRKA